MTTITKLFSNGLLQSAVELDEITYNSVKVSPTGIYSAGFDETTLTGAAERRTSDGKYLVSGFFDEVSIAPGPPPTLQGSLLFNGSSQYLNTPSTSAFAFGTGDFTMETWIYPTNLSGRLWFFSSNTDNVDLNGNGGIFYFGSGGIYNSATNTVITVGTWHHIALVRSSGTITLYVNGNSVMSQNGIGYNSTGNRSLDIAYSASQGNGYFTGRISNFRIVSGTALYTGSTITVPVAALPVISGTQLLLNTTNDANFLKDSSTNNFTVTNNGSVTSNAFTPF
jgi:hypothetical protein